MEKKNIDENPAETLEPTAEELQKMKIQRFIDAYEILCKDYGMTLTVMPIQFTVAPLSEEKTKPNA